MVDADLPGPIVEPYLASPAHPYVAAQHQHAVSTGITVLPQLRNSDEAKPPPNVAGNGASIGLTHIADHTATPYRNPQLRTNPPGTAGACRRPPIARRHSVAARTPPSRPLAQAAATASSRRWQPTGRGQDGTLCATAAGLAWVMLACIL